MTRRRFIFLAVLCILAAAANFSLSTVCMFVIRMPLYLDTLFSAAVCFTAGLVPALITVLLSHLFLAAQSGDFSPFIICSIAEVLLIFWLKPSVQEKSSVSFMGTFASLLFLYICACITVSVLGGIVDLLYYGVFAAEKGYFSAEDIVKINLLQNRLPSIALNILSRIPVNAVDRFIVIFGGFGISLGIRRSIN